MRTFAKTMSTLALTLATVATSSALTTTAARADQCAGFPSIPQAYLCIVAVSPQNAVPTVVDGPTVTVPAFCYLLGCTSDTPVTTKTVVASDQPVLVFTYNGQTYSIPGWTPIADLGPVITALNGLLSDAGQTEYELCQAVAQRYNSLDLNGQIYCANPS